MNLHFEVIDNKTPRVSNFKIVLRLEKSKIFLVFFVCRSIYASTLPVEVLTLLDM